MTNGKQSAKVVLWSEQLRRMREMQYAYHRKFFHGLYFFLVLVVVGLLWDSPVSLALVPFFIVTAGTQSCFYLHFVDFARVHACHLESRLNKRLGKGTLLGSEIEDLYFYPIEATKVGGFVPSAPLRFFSFFTLHWIALWLALAAFALWRLLPMMGSCGRQYLGWLAFWAFLNLAYLVWFFGRGKALQAVRTHLQSSVD